MRIKQITLSVIISILLIGCTNQRINPKRNYGEFCSLQAQCNLAMNVHRSGGYVKYFGDHIFISIPIYKLFSDRSSRLGLWPRSVLNDTANFLRCYKKIAIRIDVYSNTLASQKENIALATLQSKQIVDYLSYQHIDARLICGVGKTGASRVEIITKRIP